ncbi:MAG: hypothetical protein AAF748_09760 [Pseudomonadota bacterium]
MKTFSKTALLLALALGAAPALAAGSPGLFKTPSGPTMQKINFLCNDFTYCQALKAKCAKNNGLWTTEVNNPWGKPVKGVCRM